MDKSWLEWDLRFLKLAKHVGEWSKDPSTKVGAVIARPDKSIASTGFNGFPQSMQDLDVWLQIREEKYSRIIHGEMNALLFAREPVRGYTLYTSSFAPCDRCAVHMIQAGIQRFVFPRLADDKRERWEASLIRTKTYFDECHIAFEEIDPILLEDAPSKPYNVEQLLLSFGEENCFKESNE